jgi:hypothetical protein
MVRDYIVMTVTYAQSPKDAQRPELPEYTEYAKGCQGMALNLKHRLYNRVSCPAGVPASLLRVHL